MNGKQTIHAITLACLVIAAGYRSIYGPSGIKKYQKLGKEIRRKQQEIKLLNADIASLKKDIDQWENDPFKKEKVGRTDLLLACSNEIVYLFPEEESL